MKRIIVLACAVGIATSVAVLREVPVQAFGQCCQVGTDCGAGTNTCCPDRILDAWPCSSTDPNRSGYCVAEETCYPPYED